VAARFKPVGLVKTIPNIRSSNEGFARPFLLVRCSPAFHRLLKEAYTVRTSFATSCKSYSTACNEVAESDVAAPTTIDELISRPNVDLVESYLKKWIHRIGFLKNLGKEFKMTLSVQKTLDNVVEYSLQPTSSPELRYKCLIVLLTRDDDVPSTEMVLKQTVSEVMSLPIKVVSDIINILSEAKKTPLRESVRKDLVLYVVNHRCYELGPKNVVFYMYQLDNLFDMKSVCLENRKLQKSGTKTSHKSKSLHSEMPDQPASSKLDSPSIPTQNLDARTIAVANEIKVKDLSRVILLLGKWLNRNEPLLNAVLHRLSQDDLTDFTYIQLYNVLFACSVLRLHNKDFFEQVFARLATLHPPSTASACGVLSSMSFLRYRDVDVILAILDYLKDKTDSLSMRQATNVLTSLSNLYPVPFEEHHAQVVLDLCNRVYGGADSKDPDEISVVYSLAVLLLLSGEIADATLNSDTVRRIQDTDDTSKYSNMQRLAQINMAARHELKEYKGSLLSDEELKEVKQIKSSSEVDTLTADLLKAIRRFADLSNYVQTTDVMPPGLNIAAVMCANNQGGVLPLSSLDKDKEPVHRLALMVVPYSQVTMPDQIPVGSQQLKGRLLRHLGYTPVYILYSDLRSSNSPAETVKNIKLKICAAVQDVLSQSSSNTNTSPES